MADALNELWLSTLILADDDSRRPLPDLESYDDEFLAKEDLYYCSLLHKQCCSKIMAGSPQSTICDMESCWINPTLLSSHIQTPQTQRVYVPTESSGGFCPNPSLSQKKLLVAQFCHLKRQQLIPAWRSHSRREYGKAKTHVGFGYLSTDSPPLQPPPAHKQQPGYGMRAVFLNPRKESSGTGVFLPRKPGVPSEPREKPACSAALLPARVVQVLNLDLDDLGIHPRLLTHDSDSARNHRRSSNRPLPHRRSSNRPLPTSADVRLPPEWTY